MDNKIIAMIPCAGRGSRMLSLTDDCPKAMLPLKNKPIIGWHLDKLIEENIKDVCIIIGYKKEKLINYVDKFYGNKLNITYVEQTELLGLAHAINIGIKGIKEKNNCKLLIILGDLIIKDNLKEILSQDIDFIGYDLVNDYKRWCLLNANDKDEIVNFIDKPINDPKTRKAIIGIYYFTDIKLLYNCINNIIENDIKIKNEYQLSTAMELYKQIKTIYAKKFNEWFDCGEIESFNNTRKNITRYFNTIEITKDKTVIKKSENKNKLKQEINWYLNMPNKLKTYLSQLIDYNVDGSYYELEYINFTPMQELFLYNLPNITEWDKIFNIIFNMINKFKKHSKATIYNTSKLTKNILIDKTNKRLNELKAQNEIWETILNENYIKINNNNYKNIPLLIDDVYKYINDKLINDSINNWQIIHGDLFFGNMLYDISSNTLKIIDPRGNFGIDGVYGDIRYDLAKLNHSILGKYDFIVNGLYSLNKISKTEFDYIIYTSGTHNDILDIFKSNIEKNKYDYNDILIITGILFLSMIPLHKDNINNQMMFYIKAIEIFNSVF